MSEPISNRFKMSLERLNALKEELTYLETVREKEVAELIKEARSFGDLSENSEYDEAKNEQGLVEQRILELEATIKNAKIVNKDSMDVSKVGVGVHVVVVDEDDFEEAYDIVGSTEYDPLNGKISEDSPVGAALKGHKAGETVTVDLPTGATMKLTIKSVEVHR